MLCRIPLAIFWSLICLIYLVTIIAFTLAYIGMALLASSLLEAYGLWETVARMLPK